MPLAATTISIRRIEQERKREKMLKLEPVPAEYTGTTMHEWLESTTCGNNMVDKIHLAIELIKTLPVDGCITGSCLLPGFDPDGWGTTPDIDLFVFGEDELVSAIDLAQWALKMEPGKGDKKSNKQELWKLRQLKRSGLNYKIGITTYSFNTDGVILNVTFKQRKFHGRWVPVLDTPGVLQTFDMSIVMQGYDIQHHVLYDMRVGDPKVAIPNPLRSQDTMLWTVARWIRQFDRVVKYYNRGFDTRPMAKFYIKMIDECIDAGCLFDSEESHDMFESYTKEFEVQREKINKWYEEHKED